MPPSETSQSLHRLDALLRVTRLVSARAPRETLIDAVARAISEQLGFATVVLNLHREATDDFEVAVVHGSASAREALLGSTSTWSDWGPLLQERFRVHGVYFVPAGEVDWDAREQPSWLPDLSAPVDTGGWHPEDALFAVLEGAGGRSLGLVSVDEPLSGRRPPPEDLAVLGTFAASLGSVLELADADAAYRGRSQALAALAETSAVALGTLDVAEALGGACEAVAAGLGFSSVEVALVEGSALRTTRATGEAGRLHGLPLAALESELAAAPLAQGCHRLATGDPGHPEELVCRLTGPDGRAVGILRAARPRATALPGEDRRRLLHSFAQQLQAILASAAHAAVQHSEALKSGILEAALDAIVTVDPDGRLVEYNAAAERIFGHSREHALGRDMADLIVPPELRAGQDSGMRRYLAGELTDGRGVGRRIEVPALRADGSTFPCEIAVVRVKQDGPVLLTAYLRDISDRVAAREALEHERDQARYHATHDRLTGLLNRAAALEHLAERLSALDVAGRGCVAVCLGLDDLRLISESLGRSVGDRLLCGVAERLLAHGGEATVVARPGDQEFLLLAELESPDAALAAAFATRVASAMRVPFDFDELSPHVQCTIGWALGKPGEAGEELLRRADVARSQADGARSRMAGYAADADVAHRTLDTLGALRRALDRDELVLHYQPLYDVGTGHLAGLESLLRWRRDGERLVPPGEFIPLAETSGLMGVLGDWVIDEACRQARAWADAGYELPVVGVNVSPQQLAETDVPASVAAALARHGVSPGRFCVEITESAMALGVEELIAVLDELGAYGVRRALDDFGTEYSSLTRLAELPVNLVKLDRAFLARVPEDVRATRLLGAIMGIAEALDMLTVAEGIETADQLDVMRGLEVPLVQGFLLGRPEPAEAVCARLSRAAQRAPGSVRAPA